MNTTDYLLASGLVCAAVGAGLAPFAMLRLVGLLLLVVAFVLLVVAGSRLPASDSPAFAQKGIRRFCYFAGVIMLFGAALGAADLGFSFLMENPPHILRWALVGLSSFLASGLIGLGLRYRAGWAWKRCMIWAIAVLCVSPAAFTILWSLRSVLPLTA
jgi:hypothetical protein